MQDFKEGIVSGLRYAFKKGSSAHSPLLVGVHGKAGTLFVLHALASTYPKDFGVVYFEASSPDSLGGFSWWDFDPTTDQIDAQWEKALPSAEQLALAIQGCIANEGLAPSQKFAIGFSQGGGLLSVLAQSQTTLFSKLAILASFVVKAPFVPSLKNLSCFWAHGELDDRISIETARRGANYLVAKGASLQFVTDSVGHKVGSQGMRALKEFWTTP